MSGSFGSRRTIWVITGCVLCLGIALALFRPDRQAGGRPAAGNGQNGPPTITIGGVERPVSDVAAESADSGTTGAVVVPVQNADVAGAPRVHRNANPMVASVVEALESEAYPERLSPYVLPKPFDLAQFQANPAAYLNIVEPGRVFQPAQPGEGLPLIRSDSNVMFRIPLGETVSMRVAAAAEAPVTFTTFDGGVFHNSLPSITVRADIEGMATVRFSAVAGTSPFVRILAASPLSSGQIEFAVLIDRESASAVANNQQP